MESLLGPLDGGFLYLRGVGCNGMQQSRPQIGMQRNAAECNKAGRKAERSGTQRNATKQAAKRNAAERSGMQQSRPQIEGWAY